MALTVNTNMKNDADGYLTDAKFIKGTYVVVNTTDERDNLYSSTAIPGTLCYVIENNKTYRKTADGWAEENKVDIADIEKDYRKSNDQDIIDNEIKGIAERAETIARGRATGYVFDTLEALNTALEDETFVASLVLGDNLYIRATNVPDYWWDGTQKQQLEAEKPDLSGFVKDVTIDGKSVVDENNVAVMPHATTNLGVVGVNPYWGITVHSNGNLQINGAKAADINARNSFLPITPSVMEYAVKESLTNTMSNVWEDESAKAAARNRFGAVSSDDVATAITEALNSIHIPKVVRL